MVQYDHEDVAAGRVRWWDMTPTDWRERAERALAEVTRPERSNPSSQSFSGKMALGCPC